MAKKISVRKKSEREGKFGRIESTTNTVWAPLKSGEYMSIILGTANPLSVVSPVAMLHEWQGPLRRDECLFSTCTLQS